MSNHDHDDSMDAPLQRAFDALRDADRTRTPDYATMAARAKAIAATDPAPAHRLAEHTLAVPTRRWTRSPLTWAVPALAAAGLGAVLLMPRNNADADFETLVSDWSRTSASFRTPTDGLLALPGAQFLRSTPVFTSPTITLPSLDPSTDAKSLGRPSRSESPS